LYEANNCDLNRRHPFQDLTHKLTKIWLKFYVFNGQTQGVKF